VKATAEDLRALLSAGTVTERKAFIRSFVQRTELDGAKVTIEYTIPLHNEKAEPPGREVLPIERTGSPLKAVGRTRRATFHLSVGHSRVRQ